MRITAFWQVSIVTRRFARNFQAMPQLLTELENRRKQRAVVMVCAPASRSHSDLTMENNLLKSNNVMFKEFICYKFVS